MWRGPSRGTKSRVCLLAVAEFTELSERHLDEHRAAAGQGSSDTDRSAMSARHLTEHRQLADLLVAAHRDLADRHEEELAEMSARHIAEHGSSSGNA